MSALTTSPRLSSTPLKLADFARRSVGAGTGMVGVRVQHARLEAQHQHVPFCHGRRRLDRSAWSAHSMVIASAPGAGLMIDESPMCPCAFADKLFQVSSEPVECAARERACRRREAVTIIDCHPPHRRMFVLLARNGGTRDDRTCSAAARIRKSRAVIWFLAFLTTHVADGDVVIGDRRSLPIAAGSINSTPPWLTRPREGSMMCSSARAR